MSRKADLLENIETSHRQLERYIFYFEKDEAGKFSASERPKFRWKEILDPGVFGEWSLKDLLAFLIDRERDSASLLASEKVDIPGTFPEPGMDWGSALDAEFVPVELQKAGVDDVLKAFPESYQILLMSLKVRSEEELFERGLYDWSGENAAAEYVRVLTIDLYDWVKERVRAWRKHHAGKQLDKEVILERMRTERRRLDRNLEAFPYEEMEVGGVVSEWSLKDLLAHLVEWERMFMGWYQAGERGETPDVPAPGYTWSEMDALNEHIYQKHRDRKLETVLVDFKESYRQVYALVECIPEEEMFARDRYSWLGKGNLVNYILANTANHYRWAKEKVRAWLKERHGNTKGAK